jgi:hypothetical protein
MELLPATSPCSNGHLIQSSLISCKILVDVAETPSKILRFRSFHKFQAVYIMTETRKKKYFMKYVRQKKVYDD